MKCAFCEQELTPEMVRAQGCGACHGGCRKVHCPYCGEENPVTPEIFAKLFKSTPAVRRKGDQS